ncbi:hypothetical protein IH824_19965, partial [candidate division KSB1 bacterium]|nr:hypothetical protein [candidate division KSB1 bacterium]
TDDDDDIGHTEMEGLTSVEAFDTATGEIPQRTSDVSSLDGIEREIYARL